MNLPNPKGGFFYAKGVEEGISKFAGLKEKSMRGFSRGTTLGFFNSSNWAQVLAHSSRW